MLLKEVLQKEIEAQQELGYNGLLEEDQYLVEINLDNLETSSGEQQEYWLVAICAAQKACLLTFKHGSRSVGTRRACYYLIFLTLINQGDGL
jgi:hypothetical protein